MAPLGTIVTLYQISSTEICSPPYILLRQIEDDKPAIAPPNKAISSQYSSAAALLSGAATGERNGS